MNVNTLKRILLTRKIELFLSSDSIEGPEFDWGYCCQRVRLGGASPEPELWPPSRLQLALLRRNQTRAPTGKYFSTISEIIWRAEPKICEAICYECSSLVNTHTSDGGLFEHFLWPMQSSSFMVCGCQGWWRSDGPGPEPFHLGSSKNEADPAFCRDVCKPALCKMQNSLRLDKVKHKPHLFNLASERHAKKGIILYFTSR